MLGCLVSVPHGSFIVAFLSYLGTAYFSRQLCGPLLPPAQECNSLQCISFTHRHSSISLHFCASIPSRTSPSPKDSVTRCPHLKLEYPSPDTAEAFCTTSKRTRKPERFCLLQQSVPAPQ